MRSFDKLSVLMGLALALAPAAARAGGDAAAPKVETWVGTWSGKATSKGCTSDVTAKIDLDVAVTSDGGLRSNGDVLEDGLGDLDWTVAKGNLTTTRTGMTGTLSVKGNSAKLAVKTDGGCSIKATLKRASSGIADCDRLLALATVESQCNSIAADTRGKALSDAKGAWSGWSKLKGKKKSAQAAQCKAQADTLASTVSQCTGSSIGGFTSGLAQCDEYVRLIDSYMRCDKIPQAARDAAKQGIDAMKQGWANAGTMPPEAQKAANDACQQANDALKQGAAAMGCSL